MGSCLIEKIREEYLGGVNLGVNEKREDVAKRYDDLFALFTLGLKMKDTALMRATLDIINKYQESVYRIEADVDSERRGAIIAYAKYYADLEKAEKGELEDLSKLARTFISFCFDPSEMLEIYRKIGRKNASFEFMKELFDGVREIIQALSISSTYIYDVDKELKDDAVDFLIPWLDEFWPLLEENEEDFVNADFGFSSPFIEIVNCLCDMTYNTAFDSSFKTLFSYLTGCVEKYGWGCGGLWKDELEGIISNAAFHDDRIAFETAMNEAVEKKIDVRVDSYPKESLEILSSLFSLGKCLPGTRDGRNGFFDMIRRYNPSSAVIRLTLHPSYFSSSESMICTAVKNPDFSPEKYHLLVSSNEDLNPVNAVPPLAWAYYNGSRKAIDALIALGSDPDWKDKNGNNILHTALSLDKTTLGNVVSVVPVKYFLERNNNGKTPLDIYYSKEK